MAHLRPKPSKILVHGRAPLPQTPPGNRPRCLGGKELQIQIIFLIIIFLITLIIRTGLICPQPLFSPGTTDVRSREHVPVATAE